MTQKDRIDIQACGVCNSKRYKRKLKDKQYSVNKCLNCGTHWVTPRLQKLELRQIYQDTYWKNETPSEQGYANYFVERDRYQLTFERRINSFQKYLPNQATIKVLDIGCANGVFLETLSNRLNISGFGIDISQPAIEQAQSKVKKENIQFANIEITQIQKSDFDVATMWDVIEHIPDPTAFLEKVYGKLKKKGILILETQNINAVFARMMGAKWHHFKHEEHLYHFNPQALESLLKKVGFEVLLNTTKGAGKYVSMDFLVERSNRVSPFLSKTIQRLLGQNKGSFYLNPKDEMLVVARKI